MRSTCMRVYFSNPKPQILALKHTTSTIHRRKCMVCRRVVCENLQGGASAKGQAAASSTGAVATVEAAAASERLQVGENAVRHLTCTTHLAEGKKKSYFEIVLWIVCFMLCTTLYLLPDRFQFGSQQHYYSTMVTGVPQCQSLNERSTTHSAFRIICASKLHKSKC